MTIFSQIFGQTHQSVNESNPPQAAEIYDFLVDFTFICAYAYHERTHKVNASQSPQHHPQPPHIKETQTTAKKRGASEYN